MIRVDEKEGHLDLQEMLKYLGTGTSTALPIQSVLVEAGPGLATALLKQDLVDRLFVFVAPKIVGDGISAITDLGIHFMKDALSFEEIQWSRVGEDLLLNGFLRKYSRKG